MTWLDQDGDQLVSPQEFMEVRFCLGGGGRD